MDDHVKPTRYEIHVRGILSDRLLGAFPELGARMRTHETVLRGELPDQAALHGVLGRIEALGLELLEVRRVPRRGIARAEADHGTEETVGVPVGSDDDASSGVRRG